jgi:fatty-acid desaturase
MLQGLLHLSWWGDIIATLLLIHITIISITVYLHRHQAQAQYSSEQNNQADKFDKAGD